MCTPNYIRSDSPITDLAFYSLKMNNNIPTTYATTRPFGFQPFSAPTTSAFRPQRPTSVNKMAAASAARDVVGSALPRVHPPPLIVRSDSSSSDSSARSLPFFPHRPASKFDLLVQTATSAELEPIMPAYIALQGPAGYPAQVPRPPSLCSSHSSTASLPLPRTPTGESHVENANPPSHHHHIHTSHHSKKHLLDLDEHELHNPLAIKLASPSVSTKRQRSGPSCDCCRARKIKCDSEIVILAELPANLPENSAEDSTPSSEVAHCQFLTADPHTGYQYFKIIREEAAAASSSRHRSLSNFSYLKFKPCSACVAKKFSCCFSKGFTRNDIIKFNKSERMHRHESPEVQPVAVESDAESVESQVSKTRASKKTSCAVCRFKKIKCIKIDGTGSCLNCTRKLLDCSYE